MLGSCRGLPRNVEDYQIFLTDYEPIFGSLNNRTGLHELIIRLAGIPATSIAGDPAGDPTRNDAKNFAATYRHGDLLGVTLSLQGFYYDFYALYGGDTFPVFQDPAIAPVGTLFDQSALGSKKYGAKLTFSREDALWHVLQVIAGADYLRDRTNQELAQTGRLWVPNLIYRGWAPFVQLEQRLLGDAVRVSGGVRWENVTLDVPDFTTIASSNSTFVEGGSPSFDTLLKNAGIVVEPLEGLSVFASYAQGFTMPDAGLILRAVRTPGQNVEDLVDLQLHHHLFAGEIGETVTGFAGIAGLLFVVTGLILWWRTRQKFELRLLPQRFRPGPIVRHHRDLGALAAPLLVVTMLTGIVMVFAPLRSALIGAEVRAKETLERPAGFDAAEALAFAKIRFPGASIRRITLPAKPGDPIAVRMRQPFEWTPNGRTQVSVAADGKVTIEDAATANGSAWLSEKAYPVHSAKVGGLAWKLAMTLSGVALSILGSLATWSFWTRRVSKARSVAARLAR